MTDTDNHLAYVEDADSDGNPVGARTYVSTAPPSVKEEANVSRTRRDKGKDRLGRRDSSSPAAAHHTDSDSTTHPRSPLKRDTRRSKDKAPKKDDKRRSLTHERPTPRKTKTLSSIHTAMPSPRRLQDPSSYFGVSPTAPSPIITAAATASRPRAYTATQRPSSYYAPSSYYGPSASRPPPASARLWPPQPPLGTSFPPQSPFPPPTAPAYQGPYPPPYHAFPPAQPQPHMQSQPQPQHDYFSQSPRLVQRPDYRRPTSAMGRHVPSPLAGYGQDYDDDQDDGGVLIRRPSLKTRTTRQEEDRVLMPPPTRRPSTSIPTHSPFAAPSEKRRSIGSIASLSYEDESVDDDSLYSASEQTRYDYRPHAVRRPSLDPTVIYDIDPRFEQSPGRRSRRNSHYGARNLSTEREVEDKMQTAQRAAQRYQARVDGPTDPLTFESIRKINKTPSGGTRSHRGEQHSGYAATNTNRTSLDTEDMTILVRGTATLTIGNAHMDVREGAEIRIPTGAAGVDRSSRSGGSDRASSTYETERERELPAADDRDVRRTTRADRERGFPRAHGRARSRAGSHSRGAGLPFAPPTLPPPTDFGAGSGYHQYYQQYAYAPPGSHPYKYPNNLNQF